MIVEIYFQYWAPEYLEHVLEVDIFVDTVLKPMLKGLILEKEWLRV